MKQCDHVATFQECDRFVAAFEQAVATPIVGSTKTYYTGVDLGTACVVLSVLDDTYRPVAGAWRYVDVVRDGMVVDYLGAIKVVKAMKEELEEKLGTELVYAAAAIPPNTDMLDGGAVKNVVQAAGFEVTALLDEPSAANNLLKLTDGAVVDIGGGTTGISILKDGEIVAIHDEATGGRHLSLVIAGAYKMGFEEADLYKRDVAHHKELLPIVRPVMEKIATIITEKIEGHDVEQLVLVGGSSSFVGIERVIEQSTGIKTTKPHSPMFVTPLGIALACTSDIRW